MPSTLEELVDHYRENELPSKTPYTQQVYEGYLKTRILPTWGTYSLHAVRTVKVEEWLGTLSLSNWLRPRSETSCKLSGRTLCGTNGLGAIPLQKYGKAPSEGRCPEFLTVEEINTLLAELAEPYRTMIFVVAPTGLRLSELLGLKWQDFDFEAARSTCVVALSERTSGK